MPNPVSRALFEVVVRGEVTVPVRGHVLEPPEAAAVSSSWREPTRVRSKRRCIDLHRWGSGHSSSRRAQAPHGPGPGSAGTRPSLTRDEPRVWAGVGSAAMEPHSSDRCHGLKRRFASLLRSHRSMPSLRRSGSVELRAAAWRSRRVVYRPEPSSEGAGVRGLELEWAERLPTERDRRLETHLRFESGRVYTARARRIQHVNIAGRVCRSIDTIASACDRAARLTPVTRRYYLRDPITIFGFTISSESNTRIWNDDTDVADMGIEMLHGRTSRMGTRGVCRGSDASSRRRKHVGIGDR